jgi:chromosome condensin MukBEF ATPase and DNA-binding subunit MukB
MTNLEREVGKLEARMETVEAELHAIRADVREIRDALVGARAGWFLLTAAIALSSAVGAAASRFLPINT